MAKHKKNEPTISVAKDLGSIQIQDAEKAGVYVFTLWTETSGIYMFDISFLSDPVDGFGFYVDLYGLQKLTSWFAKVALCASKYYEELKHLERVQIHDPVEEEDICVFSFRDHPSGKPRYELLVGDDFNFVVDLYGLQKLTSWLAKVVLRASKYEAQTNPRRRQSPGVAKHGKQNHRSGARQNRQRSARPGPGTPPKPN